MLQNLGKPIAHMSDRQIAEETFFGAREPFVNTQVSSKITRRACKFGIEHILQLASNYNEPCLVHFILDEMVQTEVAAKQVKTNGDHQPRIVPITFSELRYVFRNWDRLADKVVFYRNQKVCPAPWDDDVTPANKQAWANYATRREQKQAGLRQKVWEAVDQYTTERKKAYFKWRSNESLAAVNWLLTNQLSASYAVLKTAVRWYLGYTTMDPGEPGVGPPLKKGSKFYGILEKKYLEWDA
jgi:hypothetical protein